MIRWLRGSPTSLSFSTCAICNSKQLPKALQKNKLYKSRTNRFARDVGLRHQLESLGVDRDDLALHPEMISSDTDPADLRDSSKKFRKKHKADDDPERIKRILIQKKLFPLQTPPNLLSCVEKETIRYLHQKDPHEWTIDRLADSFPVDKQGLKKILKRRGPGSAESVMRLDAQAADNWKLLCKGKLKIDKALEDHLRNFERKHVELTQGDEAEVRKLMEDKFRPTTPKLIAGEGEFTKIITEYERKARKSGNNSFSESDEKHQSVDHKAGGAASAEDRLIDVGSMESLFGRNTVPGTPAVHESSPYGETALLRTSIDLSKEKNMDIERFRELYLQKSTKKDPKDTKTLRPFSDSKSETVRASDAYFQWLEAREARSKHVSTNIEKVNVEDVLAGEHEPRYPPSSRHTEPDFSLGSAKSELTGQEEVFVFSDRGYQTISTASSPDYIEIPPELKKKYSFFQVGDSVYDTEGEFLYRMP